MLHFTVSRLNVALNILDVYVRNYSINLNSSCPDDHPAMTYPIITGPTFVSNVMTQVKHELLRQAEADIHAFGFPSNIVAPYRETTIQFATAVTDIYVKASAEYIQKYGISCNNCHLPIFIRTDELISYADTYVRQSSSIYAYQKQLDMYLNTSRYIRQRWLLQTALIISVLGLLLSCLIFIYFKLYTACIWLIIIFLIFMIIIQWILSYFY